MRAGRNILKQRTRWKPALLLVCVLLAGIVAHAESFGDSGPLFRHWRVADGLPDDSVTALLQSRDGYLWVGTAHGLARFDGAEFEETPVPTGVGAHRVAVSSLCEDESQRLWIGTADDGLFYRTADGIAAFRPAEGNLPATITSLADDHQGNLWIGTPAGVRQLRLDRRQLAATPPALTNGYVTSLHATRTGTLWITTRAGMIQYHAGQLTPVEFSTEALGRSPEYIGLYEDKAGNLWAFGDSYLINLNEGKRFNYFRGGDAGSLRIWTLYEGRNGELWIATSGQGLFTFAEGQFRPLALRENHLSSDVRAICEDTEGNLWLGTDGGGLVRLKRQYATVLGPESGLPDETPTALAAGADGSLLAGYEKSGLYRQMGRMFEPQARAPQICSLAEQPDGGIWLGTDGNGLRFLKGEQAVVFTTREGLASDRIRVVNVVSNQVWLGTSAGTVHNLRAGQWLTLGREQGLSGAPVSALLAVPGGFWVGTDAGEVFEKTNGTFQCQIAAGALAGAAVSALDCDPQGRLWVGTAGAGLACLDPNGTLTQWNRQTGFPGENITGLLTDTNGQVWVATENSIYMLAAGRAERPAAAAARLIWREDSPAAEPLESGFPRAIRTGDGKLWFALHRRIVGIDPRRAGGPLPTLRVYLRQVRANGVKVPLPEAGTPGPLRLPSNLTSLEIVFSALNFTDPDKVRFAYKLKGFDSDWVDGGTERKARYGHLPYGNYTFMLRVCNADGVWSENTPQLAFIHPPPVWISPAAIAAYCLLVGALVIVAVRAVSHRRLRFKLAQLAQQEAMEKERMRIAQDMHDEIGSKLTKISYLSELPPERNRQTDDQLLSIASTSRELLQSLDEIVWAVNPRNDFLEHLASYFSHHATEYLHNTPVELEMQIPEHLPATPLSAETRHNLFLAFEEALANALKHSRATQVRVEMKLADGRFQVIIQDNGIGLNPDEPRKRESRRRGNGLDNMRRRLADINGECRIESIPGAGTTVNLSIKLNSERTFLS